MTKISLSKRATSILGLATVALMVSGLVGCASDAGATTDGASTAAKQDTIVLGADDGNEPHWQILKDKLADEGIDLEVKTITDGVQLNQGVKDGSLDINLFQHLIFLAQFNVDNNADLVPVGATAVYPLGLYSTEFDAVDKLPADAVVAVPNNPTNLARALLNLQTAGLLTLKDGGNALSTPADVVDSKVKVTPVDANQTVTALKDGSADAAVVNNVQAQRGGLTDGDIIFKEDINDPQLAPYINAFVTRAELADDPRWTKLIEAYHSPEVEEAVSKLNDGNLVFKADWTQAKLTEVLTGLESDISAAK